MNDFWQRLSGLWDFSPRGIINVIDILLVTFLVYRTLKLVRGTRAWRVVLGIGVFILALYLSDRLQLRTLHWMLDKASLLGPVALVILLLPELRQALEGFARLGLWPERFIGGGASMARETINELVKSAVELSEKRTGALFVIERGHRLDDVAEKGVAVEAKATAPLLGAIFFEGNPLHDGAALIRGDKLIAAACRLPLSESTTLAAHLHMRHRAAAGITEQSDCVVIVVSEERGVISFAEDGRILMMANGQQLAQKLAEAMATPTTPTSPAVAEPEEVEV